MNRMYEIGFIISPDATEDEVKRIVDSIVEIIKKADGIIENVDEWGRRKLAYPIGKHNDGIYVFINTEAVGSTFLEVERKLKITEKVMRFIVLRLDERLKKANRLNKKWKRAEKLYRKGGDERDSRDSRRDSRDSRRGDSRRPDTRRPDSRKTEPRREDTRKEPKEEAPRVKEAQNEG